MVLSEGKDLGMKSSHFTGQWVTGALKHTQAALEGSPLLFIFLLSVFSFYFIKTSFPYFIVGLKYSPTLKVIILNVCNVQQSPLVSWIQSCLFFYRDIYLLIYFETESQSNLWSSSIGIYKLGLQTFSTRPGYCSMTPEIFFFTDFFSFVCVRRTHMHTTPSDS